MAAIATIADAVPLHGENRVIAALGLRELRKPVGAGLCALFAQPLSTLQPASSPASTSPFASLRASTPPDAWTSPPMSSSSSPPATPPARRSLAAKLERLNRERRDTEAFALTAIENRLAADEELAAARLLVVDGDGWHRGVIGILASRVVERTAKPALVVSVEDGVAHGSGRSVDGFPLLDAIESCADLFTRFGGHAFAVGFALPAAALPELKRRLDLYAEERLAEREPERLLRIHAELPLDRITPVLAGWLRRLEPLGHSNPEPIFVARNARMLAPLRLMKDRHIRLELTQDAANGACGILRAIGWGMAFRAAELELREGSRIDVAYRIRENDHPEYGGLEVEIMGMEPPAT